jgi:hypothetical protein
MAWHYNLTSDLTSDQIGSWADLFGGEVSEIFERGFRYERVLQEYPGGDSP